MVKLSTTIDANLIAYAGRLAQTLNSSEDKSRIYHVHSVTLGVEGEPIDDITIEYSEDYDALGVRITLDDKFSGSVTRED